MAEFGQAGLAGCFRSNLINISLYLFDPVYGWGDSIAIDRVEFFALVALDPTNVLTSKLRGQWVRIGTFDSRCAFLLALLIACMIANDTAMDIMIVHFSKRGVVGAANRVHTRINLINLTKLTLRILSQEHRFRAIWSLILGIGWVHP